MPRKSTKASAGGDETAVATTTTEPRRSSRIKEQPKPDLPTRKAPAKPRAKKAAKAKDAEDDKDKEKEKDNVEEQPVTDSEGKPPSKKRKEPDENEETVEEEPATKKVSDPWFSLRISEMGRISLHPRPNQRARPSHLPRLLNLQVRHLLNQRVKLPELVLPNRPPALVPRNLYVLLLHL